MTYLIHYSTLEEAPFQNEQKETPHENPSAAPPPLKIRLRVVEYRHERLFRDPATKRATAILRAWDLPAGSTLALWRDRRKIAEAAVDLEGYSGHGGELVETFRGTSWELVVPEPEVMRSGHLPVRGENYAREIRAERFLPGDRIVLMLAKGPLLPDARRRWTLERWFEEATAANRKAAYDRLGRATAWEAILHLFAGAYPDDLGRARSGFSEAHRATPWREALRAAVIQTLPAGAR